MTTPLSISSRPRPMTAPACGRNWRHSGRFRAGFANAAPNRRRSGRRRSSATIECWASREAGGRMTSNPDASPAADLDRLLVAMRTRLHRYCARMVGSAIDGEDVLQDALIKAVEAAPVADVIGNPEGWLFRIAHNTALDHLRRRKRQQALLAAEEVDMIADQLDAVANRQIARASLRTFMRLPVAQRSSVILMDVLGCSWREVSHVMDVSLPAAKAALHRGRARLRQLAAEPDDAPQPRLSDADRVRLSAYVSHFNARDFDAIRGMIAEDVRLDLVNKTRMNGKAEVSRYF